MTKETNGVVLIKIETEKGWEVWTDVVGEPIVAIFAKEADADLFINPVGAPDFKIIALKVAKAYPVLNPSDAPLNPVGELVLNIARIIEVAWRTGVHK